MQKSVSQLPSGASKLVVVPLGALAALIAALLLLTVFLGVASPSCGEESLAALDSKVPQRLVPIYERAAAEYGLGSRGPAILAGVNWVETSFGTNLGISSAEAEGWMQFLPASWVTYGVDANGDGVKDPYNPWDAIFAAASLLHASGAPENWHDALFAYNHADWYVEKVERAARRFAGSETEPLSAVGSAACRGVPNGAVLDRAIRLYGPRAFKPLPARLWVGGGSPESVDARIWPDAVWLLEAFDLRVTAAREAGHNTHGDGTAMDMVPATGSGWDETALRAALALGWIPSCGASGSAPACPLVAAIQFVGYNGYEGHGDPAHAGSNAHLHVSWRSSEYGCPGLCEPREWVEVFPWQE
jgi:Transglycosylase SLT domain